MSKKYPIGLEILIIDNEKIPAEILKKGLEKCGHQVCVANDFYQACNLLKSDHKFHLVITDVCMQSLPMTEIVGSIAGLVEAYQADAKIFLLSGTFKEQMQIHKDLFDLSAYIRKGTHEDNLQEILSKIETLFPTK